MPSCRTPHSRTVATGAASPIPSAVDEVSTEQVDVAKARQLEDPSACGEDAGLRVAHDEAGGRRRVVVLEQLEQEPEAAAPTLRGLRREPVEPVGVDGALTAVRADEDRHEAES